MKAFIPIRIRSLMADRLIAAKINRKVELAKDDMMVRSVVFTNRRVMAVMAIRLTYGIFLVRSLCEKAF